MSSKTNQKGGLFDSIFDENKPTPITREEILKELSKDIDKSVNKRMSDLLELHFKEQARQIKLKHEELATYSYAEHSHLKSILEVVEGATSFKNGNVGAKIKGQTVAVFTLLTDKASFTHLDVLKRLEAHQYYQYYFSYDEAEGRLFCLVY